MIALINCLWGRIMDAASVDGMIGALTLDRVAGELRACNKRSDLAASSVDGDTTDQRRVACRRLKKEEIESRNDDS